MALTNAALSALLNVVVLAGIPFLCYFAFHKWRRKRSFAEITRRAGLRLGEIRYIGYCLAAALIVVAVLVSWQFPLGPLTREGSSQHEFVGLGFTATTVAMALLYGIIKTGFAEEFLFRGLIAGSLARRMPFIWANVVQALIFLAPHVFLVVLIGPELWGILPVVFVGALFTGWVRIRSGSIVGPWLLHASANVTTCLIVATRTA